MSIKESETVILLGLSGSGKTTLLKTINKLLSIDHGEIFIDNKDITNIPSHVLRRGIGYVIQNVGLLPHLTIKKNIEITAKLVGTVLAEKRLHELLDLIGLPVSILSKYPSQLSGGQQQRVGIARALANDPPIILMDEPFSALDNITRSQLQNDFINLKALNKKTILLVTHDIKEAFRLGDRIILLHNGMVQQDGSPLDFLENPNNDFVRNFIKNDALLLALETYKVDSQPIIRLLNDPEISKSEKSEITSMFFKKMYK